MNDVAVDRGGWEKELGVRLREARVGAGLSQEALALRLHQHTCAISFWETGRRVPSVKNFRMLCEALGLSSDLALGLLGSQPGG
jgi:transcriptional regulator with XRE-family HTH domain